MESINLNNIEIDENKTNKISNDIDDYNISHSILNKAKKKINKLNLINKHILGVIYNTNKDLYSAVSDKILEINKFENAKQYDSGN